MAPGIVLHRIHGAARGVSNGTMALREPQELHHFGVKWRHYRQRRRLAIRAPALCRGSSVVMPTPCRERHCWTSCRRIPFATLSNSAAPSPPLVTWRMSEMRSRSEASMPCSRATTVSRPFACSRDRTVSCFLNKQNRVRSEIDENKLRSPVSH